MKYILCALFMFLAWSIEAKAETSQKIPVNLSEIEAAKLKVSQDTLHFQKDMEQKKLDLELKKLDLENKKFDLEDRKAWISGISIAVPLLVAAFTFAFSVWNQKKQEELSRASQEQVAKTQFELKAAELVLSEDGPHGTKKKAKALMALFPDRLPQDFASKFDPKEFIDSKGESKEAKITFFQTVASNPERSEYLLAVWQALFPGDQWPQRVSTSFVDTSAQQSAPADSANATPLS